MKVKSNPHAGAQAALAAYFRAKREKPDCCHQSNLIDVVTDLGHLARRTGPAPKSGLEARRHRGAQAALKAFVQEGGADDIAALQQALVELGTSLGVDAGAIRRCAATHLQAEATA